MHLLFRWGLLPSLLILAGCGGGDPLPVAGPDASGSPSSQASPAPRGSPSPSPRSSPSSSPSPGPRATPGTTRRTIVVVGLGNPPPEPPLHDDVEVEAIVRSDLPERVRFYVDGRFVNDDPRWPFMLGDGRFDTRSLPNGQHRLDVVALFGDGTDLALSQPFWVGN